MADIAGDLFCNLSLREISSKRVVRDTRNLPTKSMILHFKLFTYL